MDFPGVRRLCLRRRRSRTPWIYLVYQEGARGKEGVRGKGRGVNDALNARALALHLSPLTPAGNEGVSSLRDGETPAHRTPRARRDRYHPHRPAAPTDAGDID